MPDTDKTSCAGSCLTFIFVFILIAGFSALFGWMTMVVLSAFNIHPSFWICWIIWILASTLTQKVRGS